MCFTRLIFASLIITAYIGSMFVFVGVACADQYSVSIPTSLLLKHLQAGRRITGYKIKIVAGHIYCLNKIQRDWWIGINPEMEQNQLEADAGHGVSWITRHDVEYGVFTDFFVIEIDPQKDKSILPKLNINFSIDVPDKEEETHIIIENIENTDLIFTPVP